MGIACGNVDEFELVSGDVIADNIYFFFSFRFFFIFLIAYHFPELDLTFSFDHQELFVFGVVPVLAFVMPGFEMLMDTWAGRGSDELSEGAAAVTFIFKG